MAQRNPRFGFTSKAPGRVQTLENKVGVSDVWGPGSKDPQPPEETYTAIWDTGCTHSVVSSKVISDLGLAPSGRATAHSVGAGGTPHTYETNTFLVNLILPNKVVMTGIRVSEGTISGADILIGMDVITGGDFAVTNLGGQTWWTFQVPPATRIDFVEDINKTKNATSADAGRSNRAERRRKTKKRDKPKKKSKRG